MESLWVSYYSWCVVVRFVFFRLLFDLFCRPSFIVYRIAQFVFVLSKQQQKVICYYYCARSQLRRDLFMNKMGMCIVCSMDSSFNRHTESMSVYWVIVNRFSKIRIKFQTNTRQRNEKKKQDIWSDIKAHFIVWR